MEIKDMLLSLSFNLNSIGFEYWITAISINQNTNNYLRNSIENVYQQVAKIHNTTRTRVERAMRTARETATERIQEKYNYSLKLTNKSVLILLSENIIDNITRID